MGSLPPYVQRMTLCPFEKSWTLTFANDYFHSTFLGKTRKGALFREEEKAINCLAFDGNT